MKAGIVAKVGLVKYDGVINTRSFIIGLIKEMMVIGMVGFHHHVTC